jgi:hypothetical protein
MWIAGRSLRKSGNLLYGNEFRLAQKQARVDNTVANPVDSHLSQCHAQIVRLRAGETIRHAQP